MFKKRKKEPVPADPSKLWGDYYKALKKEDWPKALKFLEALKAIRPKDSQVHMKVGDVLQRTGNSNDAVAAYHKAARLIVEAGFHQKALAVFKIILRLAPDDQKAIEQTQSIVDAMSAQPVSGIVPATLPPELKEPEAKPAEGAFVSDAMRGLLAGKPAAEEPSAQPDVDTLGHSVPLMASPMTRQETPAETPDTQTPDTQAPSSPEVPSYGEVDIDAAGTAAPEPSTPEPPTSEPITLDPPAPEPVAPEPLAPTPSATEPNPLLSIPEEMLWSGYLPGIFKPLGKDHAIELVSRAKETTFSAGKVIVAENDLGNSIFFIKSGTARIMTSILGREMLLAIMNAGDIFGEVGFLTGRPRTASVIALEDTLVMELDQGILDEAIESNPSVLETLNDFYQTRAADTMERAKSEPTM